MDENKNKEIFFSRAEVKEAERVSCENCFEQVVFMLKDKDHEFSMGLTTVLECLSFAIKNGDLPKLPLSWVYSVYGASLDDISYYDSLREERNNDEIFQDTGNKNR